MFDIGFLELATIGVIALLVVGPERLPRMAREVGLWVGRIRRYVNHMKADIDREIRAEDLKKIMDKPAGLDELKDVVKETKSALTDTTKSIEEAARVDSGSGSTAKTQSSGSAGTRKSTSAAPVEPAKSKPAESDALPSAQSNDTSTESDTSTENVQR